MLDHRTMLTMATAGLKPYATTGESSEHTDCARCPAPADGFDAARDVPVCHACAEEEA
ncbi:hypothetical protein ACOZ35_07640 [Halorubrum xinjiangense]|uniref:hypothetical protein n=1 Tax=Halorubrum xinjiangense TaxID=261291 RepID=UPI003C702DBB